MSTYPDPCVCGGSREKPNDDCERCRLIAQLAAERKRADEAVRNHNCGRELMRIAWREFNSIRARDGAPAGVCHDYWNQLTEQLRELVGNDDAKPWMTKAASVLVKPWENRNAHLSSEVVDLELKLAAATSRAERAENEAKRLWDGASRLADWYDRIEPPESREKFVKFANALRAQPVEGNDGI